MGRSPSTISRELRRNTLSKSGHLPHTAHRISVKRRQRSRTAKLAVEGPLREYVSSKLKKRWSPEQISHRLRRAFPDDQDMRVSLETIYQAIHVHAQGELRQELAGSLRRGRVRRKPHRDLQSRTRRFVDEMTARDCSVTHPSPCGRPPPLPGAVKAVKEEPAVSFLVHLRRSWRVPTAVRPPERRVPPCPPNEVLPSTENRRRCDVVEVGGLAFVRSSPRRTAFSRGRVGPRRDDQDMAALIPRALDLPPGPRRGSFVWAKAWRRGFSLTADLSDGPDQCAWLLGEHRRRSVVIVGAVPDANGPRHLVGLGR